MAFLQSAGGKENVGGNEMEAISLLVGCLVVLFDFQLTIDAAVQIKISGRNKPPIHFFFSRKIISDLS